MDSSKYKVGPSDARSKTEKEDRKPGDMNDDEENTSGMVAFVDTYTPISKGRMEMMLYWFDAAIAKRKTQILGLISVLFITVIIFGLVYWGVNKDANEDYTPFDGIWDAWTFMADPGTHAGAETDAQRCVAFLITILGILFFSIVLGLIVDAYQEKMEELKTGRSKVVESNHTLILGWSDKAIGLIKEVSLANESLGGGVVVVLAARPKEDIQFQLREQIKRSEYHGTKVVVRSGNPFFTSDLVRVSAPEAKCVIICASNDSDGDGNADDTADKSDASTLRIVLALKGLAHGMKGHIVAETRDLDNAPLIEMVGSPHVETVVSHDIIGRLILMSARQPGLAKVYNSILGFDGDEFYIKNWPELTGVKFGELAQRFPKAIPIGIKYADGVIQLKPSIGYVLKSTDSVVVIAEDDDTYKVEERVFVEESPPPPPVPVVQEIERILICGWRRDIRDIINLLDKFVADGSEVHMMSQVPLSDRDYLLREQGLDVNQLENLRLVHHCGNSAVRKKLEALPIETFSSAMILADESRENDMLHSDSHALSTLLLLRDIQKRHKESLKERVFQSSTLMARLDKWNKARWQACSTICEILDHRTEKTIASNTSVSHTSDFVQSNAMVSQILAMVSEDRGTKLILNELLGPQGCSLAVKPCSSLSFPQEECSFYELAYRARLEDDIAIGYQMQGPQGVTIINPPDKSRRQKWEGYDIIVVTGTSLVHGKDVAKIGTALSALQKNKSSDIRCRSVSYHSLKKMEQEEADGVRRKSASTLLRELSVQLQTMTPAHIKGVMHCLRGAQHAVKGVVESTRPIDDTDDVAEFDGDIGAEEYSVGSSKNHPMVNVMNSIMELVDTAQQGYLSPIQDSPATGEEGPKQMESKLPVSGPSMTEMC